jgi:H+/Cl- antiporter ClcA
MMNPKSSMMVYPRTDAAFKSRHSFDYDMMRTNIMLDRSESKDTLALWVAHAACGVFVGIISFLLTLAEDEITKVRVNLMEQLINPEMNLLVSSYLFWIGSSVILCLFAALMTVYVGPGAMGSGVAEVRGLLNGINFPDAIGFKTLATKCFRTLFAVCGGLCIGKEGPLVHIGANVGSMCCYLPFQLFEYL